MHKPLRAEMIKSVFPEGVKAWSLFRSPPPPADCVKLALGALMERFPDIVVSGINHWR